MKAKEKKAKNLQYSTNLEFGYYRNETLQIYSVTLYNLFM